ncbi:MAG: tetratricopeptide repeat protein [Melioribacter sp.]|uniref:tetratricopeptide repeat protein n=1 Tax=Rosettibacter primus TaxID=3111523 RepID=UPI00247DA015|nr:tetratricopeptide repeat protein [Melioribacter sp.]
MRLYSKSFLIFVLSLIIFNCSSKSDKEYFDEALQKIKEKKYAEALNNFDYLLKNYPESKYAPQSLYEIAKLYHAQLLSNISKEESLKKAVNYYKKIFYEYKNSPEAERALFVSGFIFAHELNQLDSAKYNYELFLKNYPGSELAQSVKLELENLGVSPDEILTKKMKSNVNKN